jgi:hypothetical protein
MDNQNGFPLVAPRAAPNGLVFTQYYPNCDPYYMPPPPVKPKFESIHAASFRNPQAYYQYGVIAISPGLGSAPMTNTHNVKVDNDDTIRQVVDKILEHKAKPFDQIAVYWLKHPANCQPAEQTHLWKRDTGYVEEHAEKKVHATFPNDGTGRFVVIWHSDE